MTQKKTTQPASSTPLNPGLTLPQALSRPACEAHLRLEGTKGAVIRLSSPRKIPQKLRNIRIGCTNRKCVRNWLCGLSGLTKHAICTGLFFFFFYSMWQEDAAEEASVTAFLQWQEVASISHHYILSWQPIFITLRRYNEAWRARVAQVLWSATY